jgi:hypothetical protein
MHCTKSYPILACFQSNDGLVNEPVFMYILQGPSGESLGQCYSTTTETETLIDITTYAGGGTVTPGACVTTKGVDGEACDGSTVVYKVDSVNGVFLLNQQNKHTETVYANVISSVSGSIVQNITGSVVSYDFSGLTTINWAGGDYLIDWGNGQHDLSPIVQYDYSSTADGFYQIKIYRGMVEEQRDVWFLLAEFKISKVGNNVTVVGPSTLSTTRSIRNTVTSALQDFCGNVPVGVPYNLDGTFATLPSGGQWALINYNPQSEWLGVSDVNNEQPEPIKLIENAGVEYWVRLDSSTPIHRIRATDLNNVVYNSLSISNMMAYSDEGDYRPFRGQDPQNQTVLKVEVEFFNPTTGSNYIVNYSVPSGNKIIQMQGASIVAVNSITVQDNMDTDLTNNGNILRVDLFSSGAIPSSPINVLFTFNLSV